MGRSKIKGESSPRTTTSNHSMNSQKSLYEDSDDSEDELSGINGVIKKQAGMQKNVRDDDTMDSDSVVNTKAKKLKTLNNKDDQKYVPDFVESKSQQIMFEPDFVGSSKVQEPTQPLTNNVSKTMLVAETDNENSKKVNQHIKALLINAIRTVVFRKIKFLNQQKLGQESNIFQLLYEKAGISKTDQFQKYENIRFLVQRQMNSKRNYCTDQIMAKARELLKVDGFDFDQIERFYEDTYFDSLETQSAWYVFCSKFLTCVNGDWLKSCNPSNARNQVYMFRYITPSDEAFVRWVLEVKKPKLLEEKKQGWQIVPSGGKLKKKPNGVHDSRQFSQRYAEIHLEVNKKRESLNAAHWSDLFWSSFKLVKPLYFADPSSFPCESLNGTNTLLQPEEDFYEPQNMKRETVILFNEVTAERKLHFEKLVSL